MQFSTSNTKGENVFPGPSYTNGMFDVENQHVVLLRCKHLEMNIFRVLTVGKDMEGRGDPSIIGSRNILGTAASSLP